MDKITCISQRDSERPIGNEYTIKQISPEDFTVNAYYISEHTCEISVLRHDSESGWEDLLITIDGEEVRIPESKTSANRYRIDTKESKLWPIVLKDQKIPRVIMQTAECNEYTSIASKCAHLSILDANPEYQYVFFTARERRQVIVMNFAERIVKAYDLLVAGAYQADLFRYCYLFLHGGCYIDFKMIARAPLRDIIDPEDDIVICADYERSNSTDPSIGTSYLNSIILIEPLKGEMMNVILTCTHNILNNQELYLAEAGTRSCSRILDITGPTMLYRVLVLSMNTDKLRLKHFIAGNDESYYKNFEIRDLRTSKIVFSKTHKSYGYSGHYGKLWEKGELFYRDYKRTGKWCISVYPHPYQDSFDFNVNDNILTIRRTADQGWWLDLQLKIIDNETSESRVIPIGRHHSGTMHIDFLTRLRGPPAIERQQESLAQTN
jgi:hypothetical protein